MTIYIAFVLISVVFCSFHVNNLISGKIVYPFSLLAWIIIIAFSGLRYGIGTDYFSYKTIFYTIEQITDYNESLEYGFKLLTYSFPKTDVGFNCYIFICSFITNIIFMLSLRPFYLKKPPIEKLYYILFFFITNTYFWPLNGIRQGVACSFVALSLKYIFDHNFIKFIICICIAALFHKSAILLAPIYFIYQLKISSTLQIIIVSVALVIHLSGSMKYIAQLLVPYLDDKYSRYIFNPPDFGGSGLGVYLHVIIFIVCIWVDRIFLKNNIGDDEIRKTDYLILLYGMGVVFRIFALDNIIFVRFAYYFTVFEMFAIPYFIFLFRDKCNRIILSMFFILLYFILFLGSVMKSNGLLPYENILFK